MRVLMGLLLVVSLPLRAEVQTEEERLAWLNYHLAVAEAPGDLTSDLRMRQTLEMGASVIAASGEDEPPASEPMRAYLARAQVVAAELDARVDAARDGAPFLLAGDLGCWPKTEDMSTCERRRAKLETYVPGNAYFGLVLMTHAWASEDAEAFLRVARLAAAAENYNSLGAVGFQSLLDRYRQVAPPELVALNPREREQMPVVTAMAMTMSTSFPAYQNFTQPCRESDGELRRHCLAIANKMMTQGQHLIEVLIALSLVEAIGTPADIEVAKVRKREINWLRAKAYPLLTAFDRVDVAGIDDYLMAFGSEGEVAAMKALLLAHGIPAQPPEGWTDLPTAAASSR